VKRIVLGTTNGPRVSQYWAHLDLLLNTEDTVLIHFARRLSVAALLLLLASSGTTFAQCAWALWTRYTSVNLKEGANGSIETGDWHIKSAEPTYAACIETARERATRTVEALPEPNNVKSSEILELIGGGFVVTQELKQPEHASIKQEFRCFPDTIDPRRPQSKWVLWDPTGKALGAWGTKEQCEGSAEFAAAAKAARLLGMIPGVCLPDSITQKPGP
jgi:hypothetical protein